MTRFDDAWKAAQAKKNAEFTGLVSLMGNVKFDVFYGSIECETRTRREGDIVYGEGRSIHRDVNGVIVKVTPWVVNCQMNEPAPRPWWKFWR